jgi:hypothetical protein
MTKDIAEEKSIIAEEKSIIEEQKLIIEEQKDMIQKMIKDKKKSLTEVKVRSVGASKEDIYKRCVKTKKK